MSIQVVKINQANSTVDTLTAIEVAQKLGICKQTVYELCRQNKIPHKRLSPRRIVFPKQAFESWLNSTAS